MDTIKELREKICELEAENTKARKDIEKQDALLATREETLKARDFEICDLKEENARLKEDCPMCEHCSPDIKCDREGE